MCVYKSTSPGYIMQCIANFITLPKKKEILNSIFSQLQKFLTKSKKKQQSIGIFTFNKRITKAQKVSLNVTRRL